MIHTDRIIILSQKAPYFFSREKLAWLFLLQEGKPSSEREMIILQIFDNFFPLLRHFDQNPS